MSDIKIITPSSPEIKRKKFISKSPMFIRVGSAGDRNDNIFFSQSAAKEFNIKKFDTVVVATKDDEVWLEKRAKGFIVSVDKHNSTRICDTSLTKWFIEVFKKKTPFRLDVTITDGCLYIKQKTTKCKHK